MSGPDSSAPQTPVEDLLRKLPLRVLARTASSVPVGSPLRTALATLGEAANRGAVCVISHEGGIEGIFTERDYLDKIVGAEPDLASPIDGWMTLDPRCLAPGDTADTAIRWMVEGGYRHIPIVEDGRLVGLVTTMDLIANLAEYFPRDVLNLPPRPDQAFRRREGP